MKKYPINFKTKGYPNREHAGVGEAAKRRDPKTGLYHYIVICQTFQLHGEEGEREGLRRNLPGVPTIKANEVLGEVCVVQPEPRDKRRGGKTVKTPEERPDRPTTKTAENEPQPTTKTAENQPQPTTPQTGESRGKRRNSEDDPQSHNKRHKRDTDDEVIDLEGEESDVAPRKTRSQTRREILKELKNAIDASDENDQAAIAKNPTMSGALQDPTTPVSKPKEPAPTPKKTAAVVVKTPKSNRGLRTYSFTNEEEEQPKTELELMGTAIETYQRVFWDLDEGLADLIKTKQLIPFLERWNTAVKQVVKIHKELDDAKASAENPQTE
jgi:hypothetical protein